MVHQLGAEVSAPLGLDAILLGAREREDGLGARGHAHQSRPAVGRVGHALDVAGSLQLVDQGGGRLLGDLGTIGEDAQPGARRGRCPS